MTLTATGTYHRISTADTNVDVVKMAATTINSIVVGNVNSSARFLKIYDAKSKPNVGVTTPALTIIIPGNTAGAGGAVNFDGGFPLKTGMSIAITGGMADNDATPVSANEVCVAITYL